MTLAFALRALRRYFVLILVAVLLVTGTGIAVGSWWPKTYTSHAQILMGLDLTGSKLDPQSANLYLKDRVATYAALVTADEVITPVSANAGITPEALRDLVVVTIVPETVVLEISVTGATQERAVQLTQAVSELFSSQVSKLNVRTGGPKLLPAQLSRPQVPQEPDQLHGMMLGAVSGVVGLVIGVLLALLIALVSAARGTQQPGQQARDSRSAAPGWSWFDEDAATQNVGEEGTEMVDSSADQAAHTRTWSTTAGPGE